MAALLFSAGSVTQVAAEALVVVASPSSGTGADRGAAIKAAAEVAIAELNVAGGVAGAPVRLEVEDDGCGAQPAADAARRIVARTPALVLGHPCASSAVAAARIYGPGKILFIATGTRHTGITSPRTGPTIFRLDARDDQQGAFAAPHLVSVANGGRIALISDRTAYARRIVTEARTALLALGAGEPAMLTLVAGEKDYGAMIAELGRSHVTAVLFAGFPLEAAIVLRQMREAKIAAAFLGSDATATREFLEAADKLASEAHFVVPVEATAIEGAPSVTGQETSSGSKAASYEALKARTRLAIARWAEAANRAGSTSGPLVASELQGKPPTGAASRLGSTRQVVAGQKALAEQPATPPTPAPQSAVRPEPVPAFKPNGDATGLTGFRIVGPEAISAKVTNKP